LDLRRAALAGDLAGLWRDSSPSLGELRPDDGADGEDAGVTLPATDEEAAVAAAMEFGSAKWWERPAYSMSSFARMRSAMETGYGSSETSTGSSVERLNVCTDDSRRAVGETEDGAGAGGGAEVGGGETATALCWAGELLREEPESETES
jgi:hypothetical protein